MSKIVRYIATSQDGFITDKNGAVDWLPQPKDLTELEAVGYQDLMKRIDMILMGNNSFQQILTFKDLTELEAVGYQDLMKRIDMILMGNNSFQQILTFGDWGWPHKQTYVFTSKPMELKKTYIRVTHDDPVQFISRLKERKSEKDIWLLGGAKLASSFAQKGLIDEIILTSIPHILGEGIPLGLSLDDFDLIKEKNLIEGMVQKFYLRKA